MVLPSCVFTIIERDNAWLQAAKTPLLAPRMPVLMNQHSARLANPGTAWENMSCVWRGKNGRNVRSDCAGAVQERDLLDRGRDGADRLPHHLLGRTQGQYGLLDRLCRCGRQARGAGSDAARPPRLGADRDGI